MSKQIPIVLLFLLTTTFTHSEEPVAQTPLVKQAVETVTDAQTVQVKPGPRPRSDITPSFSHFLHHFVSLFSHPKVQENIKTVEKIYA